MRDHSEAITGISKLSRRVIHIALRDLGHGSRDTQERVMAWIHSDRFVLMCETAGWDEDWVEDVFMRVDDITGFARGPIASQCVAMLKKLTPMGGVS